MRKRIASVFGLFIFVFCILFCSRAERSYTDYTVQMQEYYAEYTDIKPYWDVCTVEYPQITGIDPEVEPQINEMLYQMAMLLVNYWHLEPNKVVERLQEEYHLFASTVDANVGFHSQYLLSVGYAEVYAPLYPIYYMNSTMRALNVDLVTGESYTLADIIQLNENFIAAWCEKAAEDYGGYFVLEEAKGTLLEWFLQADDQMEDYYFFQPYFFITEDTETGDKAFVIGISIDPKVWGLSESYPITNNYETTWTVEELKELRTDSVFWEKFDTSKSVGEVLEYEDLHTNIWLGEDGGAWTYWEKWQ